MTIARTNLSSAETRAITGILEDQYRIRVQSIIQMKTVHGIVCTDGRRFIWKGTGVHATPPRLTAVRRVAELLAHHGIHCAAPILTRFGTLTAVLQDGTEGYLQPWLRGRHVDLTDRQERVSALATVAHFHRLAAHVPLHDLEDLHRLPLFEKIHLKLDYLTQMWPQVVDDVPGLGGLESPLFDVLSDIQAAIHTSIQTRLGPTWTYCHRDLAPHNLLWDGLHPVSIIDFDMAGLDDPFVDVMQWSNHCVFLGGAEKGHVRTCLDVYGRICPLSAEREAVLLQLLRFPDILIRTVSDWARSENKTVYRNRLLLAARKEAWRWELWNADVQGG